MRSKRGSFVLSLAAAALVVVIAALPAPAATTTIYAYPDADVTNTTTSPVSCPASSDPTVECNLRQAILLANANATASSSNQIDLETNTASATFNGPLQITAAGVTIDGTAVRGATVTGNNGPQDPVISVTSSAVLALQNFVISGGHGISQNGNAGVGGISNAGVLTLNNVLVTDNTGGFSGDGGGGTGGVSNAGDLTLNNVTVSNNTGGTTDCHNCGSGVGGIINSVSGTLRINDSTITGNTGGGGALVNGPSSPGGTGGVGGIVNFGLMSLTSSLVTGNTGGAGSQGSPAEPGQLVTTGGISHCTSGMSAGGGGSGGLGGVFVGDSSSVSGDPAQVSGNTGGAAGAGGLATQPGVPCGFGAGSPGSPGATDIRAGSPGLHWTTSPPAAPASADAGTTFTATAAASGGTALTIAATSGCSGGTPTDTTSAFGALTASEQIQVTGEPGSSCTVTASVTGNGWFTAQSLGSTGDVQIPDDDLSIATVSNLTVNATGPNGATVNYTAPTVTDGDDTSAPAAVCSPAAGVFAIGMTTVQCSATDSDDTNSPVTNSFTVTVVGAAGQLAALKSQARIVLAGTTLGTSLTDKLTQIQAYVAANNKAGACSGLVNFIGLVNAQKGKKLTVAQATSFVQQAQNIEAVLGC
jgi:hypothetical protein